MHQQTFAEVTFEQYRKPTRREQFLNEMHRVVPWAELVAVIASRKTRAFNDCSLEGFTFVRLWWNCKLV